VRNRYLQPALGRWLSRDPIGEASGLNLYAHVRNNTNRFHDPFGLDDWSKINCWKLELGFEESEYDVIGEGVSISVSGEVCDCKCGSTVITHGSIECEAGSEYKIGLGLETKEKIKGLFAFSLGFEGPQISTSESATFTRECDGEISGGDERAWSFVDTLTGSANVKLGKHDLAEVSGEVGTTFTATVGIKGNDAGVYAFIEFSASFIGELTLKLGKWINISKPVHEDIPPKTYKTKTIPW